MAGSTVFCATRVLMALKTTKEIESVVIMARATPM